MPDLTPLALEVERRRAALADLTRRRNRCHCDRERGPYGYPDEPPDPGPVGPPVERVEPCWKKPGKVSQTWEGPYQDWRLPREEMCPGCQKRHDLTMEMGGHRHRIGAARAALTRAARKMLAQEPPCPTP